MSIPPYLTVKYPGLSPLRNANIFVRIEYDRIFHGTPKNISQER